MSARISFGIDWPETRFLKETGFLRFHQSKKNPLAVPVQRQPPTPNPQSLAQVCAENSSGSTPQFTQRIASLADFTSGGTRVAWVWPVLGQTIFNR
jgi:hypothetical protein